MPHAPSGVAGPHQRTMEWSHDGRTYQIADADGLAIFYVVAAEQPTMRGETFDRTAQEVEETLRLGLFKLLDILAVPGALSPFVGFFEAINGNRQLIGLKLGSDAKADDAGRSLHILGRALNASRRAGLPHRSLTDAETAAAPTASTQPVASRLVERPPHDDNSTATCPYLTTLITIGAATGPPQAARTGNADHRCEQSPTLAMTETRLDRLCRSTAYKSCRHYRFDPDLDA